MSFEVANEKLMLERRFGIAPPAARSPLGRWRRWRPGIANIWGQWSRLVLSILLKKFIAVLLPVIGRLCLEATARVLVIF